MRVVPKGYLSMQKMRLYYAPKSQNQIVNLPTKKMVKT